MTDLDHCGTSVSEVAAVAAAAAVQWRVALVVLVVRYVI